MASFLDSLKETARLALCSNLDGAAAFVRDYIAPVPGPLSNLAAEALKNWAARTICNRERPPLALPFLGGQCDALYTITVSATGKKFESEGGGFETVVDENTWRGPIRSVRLYKPNPVSGLNDWFILGKSDNPDPQWNGFFDVGFFSGQIFESVTINSIIVVRLDGLPDDCGQPPPDVPDYDPDDYTFDDDIVYDDDNGNPITIPVRFTIGLSYIDADLNFNVPLTFTFSPNFDFNPDFKFDVDVNFNIGNGDINISPPRPTGDPPPRLPPPPVYDPDSPPFPVDPPQPPPGFPEPPPEDKKKPFDPVITGCIVAVTDIDSSSAPTVIDQGSNPDVYAPDLGLVSFYVEWLPGLGGWTTDIRVKNERQFVICPWDGGAKAVQGTPRAGIQWQIIPVYGKPDVRLIQQ